MRKTPVNPWTWQDRRGFTQAWRVEAPAAILFVSGQVPLDDDGNLVAPGDFDGQARRTFENLGRVLDEAGGTFGDIVKVTVYLTDIRYRETVYRVMGRWLKGVYPVSTGLVVEALARPEWLVEIDATAVISEPEETGR